MESKMLPLKTAWQCFFEGWDLFKNNYIKLLIATALIAGIELGIAFIPIIGPMLDGFLFPLFYAGFLSLAHAITQDQSAHFKHFFRPMLDYTMLLKFVFLGLVIVGFEVFSVTISSFMSSALLLPVAVVMISAFIFSVPLTLFNNEKFHLALIASVRCCGSNFAVILIIYFILMGFMIISAATFGVGLIVIIPLVLSSLYRLFLKAFPQPDNRVVTNNEPAIETENDEPETDSES